MCAYAYPKLNLLESSSSRTCSIFMVRIIRSFFSRPIAMNSVSKLFDSSVSLVINCTHIIKMNISIFSYYHTNIDGMSFFPRAISLSGVGWRGRRCHHHHHTTSIQAVLQQEHKHPRERRSTNYRNDTMYSLRLATYSVMRRKDRNMYYVIHIKLRAYTHRRTIIMLRDTAVNKAY